MKDNRDMHPRDDIRNQDLLDHIFADSGNITEKNVTDMNTGDTTEQKIGCDVFAQHLIDYSDSAAGRDTAWDEDALFDETMIEQMLRHGEECAACGRLLEQEKLLDELLNEIAQEDAQVVAPLDAQAAWRKAVRAEASAQAETADKKKASNKRDEKIIRLNRWMRSAGSIAAALVVLIAGTWGVRMGKNTPAFSQQDQTELYSRNEYYNASEWTYAAGRGDREFGMGIASGGYMMTETGLQSDGSMEHQQGDSAQDTVVKNAPTSPTAADELQSSVIEPVVLRSAERSIVSQNYDRDVQWLGDLVSEYDAYYEEKSETAAVDAQTGRVSCMMIRVPSDRLDDFLMEMDQLGTTVMTREKAEDVTGRWMDTQSRLDALKLQKDKLSSMMQSAANVQELIAMDAQMTEVISEMERLEGDLRRWQSQQSYAAVTVTLSEVFEQPLTSEASIGERMKAGFAESVNWLGDFAQDALVVLISVLPRLVIFLPVLVLAGIAIWAFVRRKSR